MAVPRCTVGGVGGGRCRYVLPTGSGASRRRSATLPCRCPSCKSGEAGAGGRGLIRRSLSHRRWRLNDGSGVARQTCRAGGCGRNRSGTLAIAGAAGARAESRRSVALSAAAPAGCGGRLGSGRLRFLAALALHGGAAPVAVEFPGFSRQAKDCGTAPR